jgi:hypothetical protein
MSAVDVYKVLDDIRTLVPSLGTGDLAWLLDDLEEVYREHKYSVYPDPNMKKEKSDD